MSSPDTMIYQVNQIARFFSTEPHDEAVEHIAKHLKQFWEPRMLRRLYAHVAEGGAGLHTLVLESADLLQMRQKTTDKVE
jgi:formate dehydrogenase subunit delta